MTTTPVLDEEAVLAKLDRSLVIDTLETAFAGLANERSVQPTQTVTVFPEGRGDCIFYPGALMDLGLVGVKISPFIQELKDAGAYPVTAYTLLLSASTGLPLLLCDSYALTRIRTAATTALALKYLTPESATTLAVVGTGKVGLEHLAYALSLRKWAQVRAFSPSASKPGERQEEVKRINSDASLVFASSCEEAVREADVVLLCTSSGTTVVKQDWLSPKVLVTSISTNSTDAHEIDPNSLGEYDVFCDYRATAPSTAGDMKIAIEAGVWSESSIVADLPELVTGVSPKETGRPRFFRSTGLGVEDLAIASLLVG
jgi:L-arginine dehydrogenase